MHHILDIRHNCIIYKTNVPCTIYKRSAARGWQRCGLCIIAWIDLLEIIVYTTSSFYHPPWLFSTMVYSLPWFILFYLLLFIVIIFNHDYFSTRVLYHGHSLMQFSTMVYSFFYFLIPTVFVISPMVYVIITFCHGLFFLLP